MKQSERRKTIEEQIQKAYLNQRKGKLINQVRIVEICREANTNRTTFYNHFKDIEDLNDKVEDAILEELFAEFPYKDLIYEDPRQYCRKFYDALNSRKDILDILAYGREADQDSKFRQRLIDLAKNDSSSMEVDVLLSFVIGGGWHAFLRNRVNQKYPEEDYVEYLNQIAYKTLNQWKEKQ